jgi:hypothetical protein
VLTEGCGIPTPGPAGGDRRPPPIVESHRLQAGCIRVDLDDFALARL